MIGKRASSRILFFVSLFVMLNVSQNHIMAQETEAKIGWLEYGDFIKSVQKRDVKAVFFNYDNTQAYVTFENNRQGYVIVPRHPELISLLLQNDVKISVAKQSQVPQNDNKVSKSWAAVISNALTGLIISIGLLGLVIWLSKRSYRLQTQAIKLTETNTEAIKENSRLLKEVIELLSTNKLDN